MEHSLNLLRSKANKNTIHIFKFPYREDLGGLYFKKQIILSALLISSLLVSAQSPINIVEGQSAIVYSLPQTELCVEVQLEKVTQKPGPFYRYSERFLATNKVIVEEKTSYQLKNVSVSTRAIPDPKRTYVVTPSDRAQANHFTVNSKGILCGINVPVAAETPELPVSITTEDNSGVALLPLGEEYMMAGSEAKMAEGAAKQIYRIRESRVSLLTADVEKLPADGASFNSMLKGMEKKETELTELFIGKRTVETQTQRVYLTPNAPLSKEVLFRLSTVKGLVAANDLSGTPYYITITPSSAFASVTDSKEKKEKPGFYSVIPAATQVSVGDGGNTYFSGLFYIPQFGNIVSLPETIFKQENLKIHIDPQTGRLLSIQ